MGTGPWHTDLSPNAENGKRDSSIQCIIQKVSWDGKASDKWPRVKSISCWEIESKEHKHVPICEIVLFGCVYFVNCFYRSRIDHRGCAIIN